MSPVHRLRATILSIVATFALTAGSAAGQANPPRKFGDYERAAIAQALGKLSAEIDPAPLGKRVRAIRVVNLKVFGKKERFLRVFNYLHWTTREYTIRREVLLRPGQLWNWNKVRETERLLRNPLMSILAVIVPLRSDVEGTVDLLVVTRDSWSLRPDTGFEIQNGILSKLDIEPSDFNFLGLRKQVGVRFLMDLGQYLTGPIYYDRNLWGTGVKTWYLAGLIFNRQTHAVEGHMAEVVINYPLWSLDQKWGARIHAKDQQWIPRVFQETELFTYDAPETAEDDAIPWSYNMREFSLDSSVVRAMGTTFENRFTLAHELHIARPTVPDTFSGNDTARASFVANVLPRSELTSALAFRYEVFRPRYRSYRNVETFDLPEDELVGADLKLESALASRYFGSEVDFVRLGANLSLTFDLLCGAGFARIEAKASSRIQQGDATDTELDLDAKLVAPSVAGLFRVMARARIARRLDDRQNIVFPLGGETGLRGYVIGAFVGRALLLGNLEVRTSPISVWFFKVGGNAFFDIGHSANRLSDIDLHSDVGVGMRILLPQFGHELIRVDWAVPLKGPTRGLPGRFSVGYKQVF